MPVDMNTIKKVLIIRMSAIGDVVHGLPVSAALKRSFPHLEISWAVEDWCADIIEGNPYVSEVIKIPLKRWRKQNIFTAMSEFLKFIKPYKGKYDLIIDLQGLFKSAFLGFMIGAKERYAFHWLRECAWLFEEPVPPRVGSDHVVQQYLDIVKYMGADIEPIEFPFYIPADDLSFAENLLREQGLSLNEPVITFNPSAGHVNKRWDPQNFARLSDIIEEEKIGKTLFIGSAGDRDLISRVESFKKLPIRSVAGQTNLKQLAALLKLTEYHICGDTGSGHITAAVGGKCVSIFGPTSPERSCPFGQLETALNHRGDCRKCNNHPGMRKCKDMCVNWVTVDEVLLALKSVMKTHAPA